jgi:selenocysteine lyase/cysteine desulfurase
VTAFKVDRTLFEVPRDQSFFNVAAIGPLIRASRIAAVEAVERRGQPWRIGPEEWFDLADARRAAFARLVGCRTDDVALTPSASYGFATAAANLPLQAGRTVLALGEDFPSGLETWRRAVEADGARLRLARPHPEETWTDAVLREMTADVAMVSVPPVRWVDGAALDLFPVAAKARAIGAALVVDATQWIGAAPFDVAALDPDFMVCAGYKWLLGPYGLGYLYVSPRRQGGRPLEENWISREGARDFARLAEHRPNYRPGARRFDAGEQVGFELAPAALAALEQIERWTPQRISGALEIVTAAIEAAGLEAGYRPIHSGPRAAHILTLEIPVEDGADARLATAGVHVSRRGRGIRISPHLHIDDTDLGRLASALKRRR